MRSWLARLGAVAAVAASAGLLPATALASGLKVTGKPALSPSFATGVTDYVSRCNPGKALKLTVDAPSGTTVSIHGSNFKPGRFTTSVPLHWGEDANVVARSKAGKRRYHIRCVPPDFPHWTFKRAGRPGAQWYLFAPVAVPDANSPGSHYVTIVDGRGTPVWWRHEDVLPFNSILLPNGQLAWGRWYTDPFGVNPSGGWEVHRLDGTLVRTLRTTGSPTDMHDMEVLPNGHYLLLTYRLRRGVDLRPYGGTDSSGAVWDGEIQELSETGKRLWRWSTNKHIDPAEDVDWRFGFYKLPDGTQAWDYFHLNSVEPDGDGFVISGRHVNAVYRIDRATKNVDWKLGGTHRPESLVVTNDSRAQPFVGQHDARVLPDGTVTVFDNHTFVEKPRGVRFRIDTGLRTATVLDQVTEPNVKWSGAEGSARRLPDGHWVVSWGVSPTISERTSSNKLVWLLTLGDAQNYRVQPIPAGRLKVTTLRHAMDRISARRAG